MNNPITSPTSIQPEGKHPREKFSGKISETENQKSKSASIRNPTADSMTVSTEVQPQEQKIAEDTPEQLAIFELNRRHAAIHTSQSYILTEKPNQNFPLQTDWFLETRDSLRQQYENTKVIVMDGNESKVKTKADIWLKSPLRRTFDGLTFDVTTSGHIGNRYNVWKGFAVTAKTGSCELYKKHILENICAGNHEKYAYVLSWMASVVQKPQEIGTALLLMGLQGTGKGVFVGMFGRLFGKHYKHLDNLHHVLGHFNNHLKDAVLVFCDEAVWGGNKKDIGRLKAMVTEKLKMVEQKGRDPLQMANFSHFIFSSNEEWPVHLDHDDRRFYVLKVSDMHRKDFNYFKAIENEMENGGLEALLSDLMNINLTNFDIRRLPSDCDSFPVKILSAPSVDQYLYHALSDGSFDVGNVENCDVWRDEVKTKEVYSDYALWCQNQKITPNSATEFGVRLIKILPSTCKKVRQRPQNGNTLQRHYVYRFCSLTEAMKEFAKFYDVEIEIFES